MHSKGSQAGTGILEGARKPRQEPKTDTPQGPAGPEDGGKPGGRDGGQEGAEPATVAATEPATVPASVAVDGESPSTRRQVRRAVKALGLPVGVLALMLAPAWSSAVEAKSGPASFAVAVQDADAPAPAPAAAPMPEPNSGEEALDQARDAKRAAYKLQDAAREVALMDTAALYGRAADAPAWADVERAEAAFRAGEILRALGRELEAQERFGQAASFDEDTEAREFAARGLLELAHLRRRHDDVEGAVVQYDELRARFPEQRRSCAHALTWSGKLMLAGERRDEGRQRLLSFADEYPEYATEAVRNADAVALDHVESGDPTAARKIVADIGTRMTPLLEAGDKQADSIRRALDRMKAAKLLGVPADVANVPEEGESES